MTFTREQLEKRKAGIGASEAAAVLGLNPYASPIDLWMVKKGLKVVEENQAMRLGTRLEPIIATMYEESVGKTLYKCDTLFYKNPIIYATPDRLMMQGHDLEIPEMGLEIKTANARMIENWGEEGTDEIPQHYLIQCVVCMAVTDVPRWDVAVLLGGQDFRIYNIQRDIDLENSIIERLLEWWDKYIVHNQEPEIDSSVSCAEYLAKKYPKNFTPLKEATPEVETLLQQLSEVRYSLKSFKEQEEAIKNILKNSIGEADGIQGGNWKATWKKTKDGKEINWESLAGRLFEIVKLTSKEEKLLIDIFTKPVTGVRKFLFTQKKN